VAGLDGALGLLTVTVCEFSVGMEP
jgi:hypothetical protein